MSFESEITRRSGPKMMEYIQHHAGQEATQMRDAYAALIKQRADIIPASLGGIDDETRDKIIIGLSGDMMMFLEDIITADGEVSNDMYQLELTKLRESRRSQSDNYIVACQKTAEFFLALQTAPQRVPMSISDQVHCILSAAIAAFD